MSKRELFQKLKDSEYRYFRWFRDIRTVKNVSKRKKK